MTKGHDITPLFKVIVLMISESETMCTTERGEREERGEETRRTQQKLRNKGEQKHWKVIKGREQCRKGHEEHTARMKEICP
ncbi:uncharacterized protein STEHIDRAFT_121333 [Stereum hirsutum FP-91666 SS1]|uniref:uncharacterized protein n=1 Tax=Stereum hirsutum (strain FP-91666) TaxID=721885 RepID=UPI000440B78D|nr:uncharacterized protein STEHIDRAFT_121333 [Stereum hirsutum FP-91666 SS1]EIM87718.1 hypothetical protein STEHIDRAFT_121333 [Stereum hirsutum FP-91666 SS1]